MWFFWREIEKHLEKHRACLHASCRRAALAPAGNRGRSRECSDGGRERSGGGGRREPPPLPDGIKLKISLKTASADKPTTPGIQAVGILIFIFFMIF